jgi:carbon monoxide dehydrogenase subunit G
MRKVEIAEHIKAKPKEVWDYISDIEKAPEWVVVMESLIETTDNPVKKGTVYKERSKIGPNKSETVWTVNRFEVPKIQVHECGSSTFKAVLTMQVTPSELGTKLRHITEYALMPIFRPIGWLVESLSIHKIMKKNLHESVQNCKKQIEKEVKAQAE